MVLMCSLISSAGGTSCWLEVLARERVRSRLTKDLWHSAIYGVSSRFIQKSVLLLYFFFDSLTQAMLHRPPQMVIRFPSRFPWTLCAR
jgi:hypothetical protein